jgi:hypothetical protein
MACGRRTAVRPAPSSPERWAVVIGESIGPLMNQVPPLLDRRGVRTGVSVSAGESPAESGELAGDGDRDDRAALPALIGESFPDAMQS